MSAVLQYEMDMDQTNKTIRMQVPMCPFEDIYGQHASCVIMMQGMHHPMLRDRVELVEVVETNVAHIDRPISRDFKETGREVYGTVSAIHHCGPALIVSFQFTGRTYNAPNQGEAYPEQNAIARRYFGLAM